MRRTLFTIAVAVGLALCTQAFGQKTGDVSQSNRISAGTVTLKKGERFRRTASGGVTVVDIATGKTNITVECICDPDTKGGDGSGKCEAIIERERVVCRADGCEDCDMHQTDFKGDDKVQVESPGGQGGAPVYRPESGDVGQGKKVLPKGVTVSGNTITLKDGYRFRRVGGTRTKIIVVDVYDYPGQEAHCFCDPSIRNGQCQWEEYAPGAMSCEGCKECKVEFIDNKGDDKLQAESPTSQGNPIQSSQRWTITPNPQLKGSTGRIAVDVPDEKASVIFLILRPGEASHIDGWYGSKAGNFLPGTYDIKVFDARITGVPVERGKDTRLHVGVLSVPFDSIYEVYDETRTNKVFSGVGSEKKKIVLPVGSYYVRAAGGEQLVVIKDGEVTAF